MEYVIGALLIVIVVVNLVMMSMKSGNARSMQLIKWADNMGWRFTPGKNREYESRYSEWSLLRIPKAHAENRMQGHWQNRYFQAFDFRETDVFNGNKQAPFSVVVIEAEDFFQPLLLQPLDFPKPETTIPFQQLKVGSQNFQNRFAVWGTDLNWAENVLSLEMQELLLQSSVKHVQMGKIGIMAASDSLYSPDQFVSALETLTDVLERLGHKEPI